MSQIIAELGINHNGETKKLLSMVEAAAEAGADFVKIQKRDVDLCYTEEELSEPCKSPWGDTVGDKVRGRELNWDQVKEMSEACKRLDIGWGCSCFDLKSLAELCDLFSGFEFHKIPSAMALYEAYVREVASRCPLEKVILLSTGLLAPASKLYRMCEVLNEYGRPFVVMVTTPLYPCPNLRCNINRIPVLLELTSRLSWCEGVGYSGHETGILPSSLAVCLGASWVERHFTLDRAWYGADQAASLEPDGLRRLVRDIHEVPKILGAHNFNLIGDEKNPVKRLVPWRQS